jgi:hypothetical protein
MWGDQAIAGTVICFKCHSTPINKNIIAFSHRLGQLLPFIFLLFSKNFEVNLTYINARYIKI